MSEITYTQAIEKVKGLDFILGPSFLLDIAPTIESTNNHILAKDRLCGKRLGQAEYNLSLLADFYMQIEKQSSIKVADSERYVDSRKPSKFINMTATGQKYIVLTEAGEKLFNGIWDCGNKYAMSDGKIELMDFSPDSKIDFAVPNFGYEFNHNNRRNHLIAVQSLDSTVMVLDKTKNEPSLLELNSNGSAGPSAEYKTSDANYVGDRAPLKGENPKDLHQKIHRRNK